MKQMTHPHPTPQTCCFLEVRAKQQQEMTQHLHLLAAKQSQNQKRRKTLLRRKWTGSLTPRTMNTFCQGQSELCSLATIKTATCYCLYVPSDGRFCQFHVIKTFVGPKHTRFEHRYCSCRSSSVGLTLDPQLIRDLTVLITSSTVGYFTCVTRVCPSTYVWLSHTNRNCMHVPNVQNAVRDSGWKRFYPSCPCKGYCV